MAKKSFSKNQIHGKKWAVWVILAVLVLAILLAIFGWTTPFAMKASQGKSSRSYVDPETNRFRLKSVKEIRFGIDIRGGVEAVFVPADYKGTPSEEELNAAAKVINFRLDSLNILDREVTTSPTSGRIIVRFPWKSDEKKFDPATAIKELGEMALLTFVDPSGDVALDGADVQSANVAFDPNTKKPVVQLTLKPEGQQKFHEVTKRLYPNRGILTIKLDNKIISAPRVNAEINSTTSIIEGDFTREEATDLAQKINGGALPFALRAENSKTISPKLGSNSLNIMTKAGIWSFVIISILMVWAYRLNGVVAIFSLAAQVVGILLSIAIPQQTLTLQGIAGIILSIGMGVDANVIISERIKEEANKGGSLNTFLYNGFTKAFSSVMDSNVTVAIAAIVLMLMGSGSILSFGYSLLVGVILNGLTGVYMTRTMIASLSEYKPLKNPALYGRKKVNA